MKKIILLCLSIFSLTFVQCSQQSGSEPDTELVIPEEVPTLPEEVPTLTPKIVSDVIWNDTNGIRINAHSGGIYYENGFYYWYGEDAKGWSYNGIHCYRSSDLINWNDLGIVMPVITNDNNSDIRKGCLIQRPKVVYNSATETYLCFFKLYPDGTYTTCYIGVATSVSPTGPFIYSHKFLGASATGTGDFALYQEGSSLFLMGVARGDSGRPSKYVQMSNDYKWPLDGGWTAMQGVQNNTEAHAILKRGNTFHLLGSGSSGWDPTALRYFKSTSLVGPWTSQGNPCSGTNSVTGIGSNLTYGGQTTFIATVQGADNQYIAMMDVWQPGSLQNSNYIWLPFKVNSSTNKLSINWNSSWNLSWY